MKTTKNVLELIGNTPLLKLEKVTKGLKANVLVKLEFLNPSGSLKDRIALRMVEQAEREGKLRPGGIIIDSTSGNMGPALSLIGAVKGYKVRLFVSKFFLRAQDRMTIMRCYGPDVARCQLPPKETMEGLPETELGIALWAACKKTCYDLEKSDPRVWWADQITNPANTASYRETMGKEILEQTDEKVDIWTASVGSGGTLFGVAQKLKKKNQNVKVIALQPADFPVINWARDRLWQKWTKRLGFSYPKTIVQTMLEAGLPDKTVTVGDEDARNMANRLCTEEGLFCGMSSGANVFAAIELAKKLDKGQNVVTVIVDRRDRYLGEYPHEHYVV